MTRERIPERSLHLPNVDELREWFLESGLSLVVTTFSVLALLNSLTLLFGTQLVYDSLNHQSYTTFLSFVIYDSPGTIGGLLGVVVIYAVLSLFYFLITGKASRYRAISFTFSSIIIGVTSQVVWNSCCNTGDTFPAGSSAIDFAALAWLIVVSITDSVRLLRLKVDRRFRTWTDSKLTAFYFILVGSMMVFYALYIQPIYLPTIQYNWRVHEFAFVSATVVSLFMETIRSLTKRSEGMVVA